MFSVTGPLYALLSIKSWHCGKRLNMFCDDMRKHIVLRYHRYGKNGGNMMIKMYGNPIAKSFFHNGIKFRKGRLNL